MGKIKFEDIDFSSLNKLQQQGTKGVTYSDGLVCYKFLNGLSPEEKKLLHRKFLDMDGIKIANTALPIDLIIKDNHLEGYTMQYFTDTITLSAKFASSIIDCKELLNAIFKTSQLLRSIHQNNIICQDLSFENILINSNGEIFFCDIDGCSYQEHIAPFISLLLKEFMLDYRKENPLLSTNLDNISMMISFYLLLFGKEIQKLSKKEHYALAKHLTTLNNTKGYAKILLDRKRPIPDIPYLDELIDQTDNYIIDRTKQEKISLLKLLTR